MPLLEMTSISMRFGAIEALANVDFALEPVLMPRERLAAAVET